MCAVRKPRVTDVVADVHTSVEAGGCWAMRGYQASGHWSAARLDEAPLGLRWRHPTPTSPLGRPATTAGRVAPHDPSGRHTCAPRPFGAAGSLGAASGVALGRRTRARIRRTHARREEEVHIRHYRADTASSTYPVRIYYGFEAVARGHGAHEAPTSLGPDAPGRPFRGGTHPGTLRFFRCSPQNYAGKVAQQLRHVGVPLDRP